MRRTIVFAALTISLLIVSTGSRYEKSKVRIGSPAPSFTVTENIDTLSLENFKGKHIVLNFWSASDGPSRTAFTEYTAWRNSNPDADIALIGINFDRSKGLYREVVRIDRVDTTYSFNVRDEEAMAIINAYGLSNGYYSVLINPDGVIVALNPTSRTLDRIVMPDRHRNIQ